MKRYFLLVIVAHFSSVFAQSNLSLLPAGSGDLRAASLRSSEATPALAARKHSFNRANLQYAWPLRAGANVAAARPVAVESREFTLSVDAESLQRGISLRTAGARAVVRLTPTGFSPADRLRAEDIFIEKKGRLYSLNDAAEAVASADELRAGGLNTRDGTIAFRLKGALGVGELTLIIPRAEGSHLLNVLDRESEVVMRIAADQVSYLDEQIVEVRVEGADAMAPAALANVRGLVLSPNGRRFDLSFVPVGPGVIGRVRLDVGAGGRGLWEARVFADVGGANSPFAREARTAFGVALPTARLVGTASVSTEAQGGKRIAVDVEIAEPGRYQLEGVLYAMSADANRNAVATAQAAGWLDAGIQSLELRFDTKVLRSVGTSYELGQIQLKNQLTREVLEKRARALPRL